MKVLLYILSLVIVMPLASQVPTIRYNLSGTDKDHTVDWDFFCTKGMKSGVWTKIAVPSNWEQQGFGGYNYGHDKVKNDEEGLYKYFFKTDAAWKNKKVFIVFEGSMTDTEVKINGTLAGPIHQGAFYRFKYDITSLIKAGGNNLLEVKVSKMSANASINKAERQSDFWVYGGIFRPVYLEIVPENFIDRVAIDAKADGQFNIDVFASTSNTNNITVQLQTLDGRKIAEAFKSTISSNKIILSKKIANIKSWNPEFPSLYDAVVSLTDAKGNILHQIKQRFGFRTVEVRKKDGIYVNGKKIILKGVNHHSQWPETGRTLSRQINIMDVKLMKEMNMNAVRMSHYPPDQSFLDVCDSMGLFVLDELTGWQAMYDTTVGRRLVKELVERDVNHPSILFWDNGNEGGWNRGLDDDFALYDPQQRTVLHPWERFNGIDTKHYPIYNYVANAALYNNDIFLPTEFMHGLYDGGHGAGLDDFWNTMIRMPTCAGGFLWAFHDEATARTDKNGWLDTDGNHAPDGILGPHREKEGSFYAIREIWSPVYINTKITDDFNGRIAVENRYLYTNLNQCSFEWKLITWASPNDKNKICKVDATGKLATHSIAPNENGFLDIHLPPTWKRSDALCLVAYSDKGEEVLSWTWPIKSAQQIASIAIQQKNNRNTVLTMVTDTSITITANNVIYGFSKTTGLLSSASTDSKHFALSNGPVHAGFNHPLKQLLHYADGKNYIVEPKYESDSFKVKWTFYPDKPAKLEYSYVQKRDAEFDYSGITFHFPEEKITGMTWLGNGPYRVWKNRMKGGQLNVWHKDYNNTVTGESWLYPEFKGYHANMYWATIECGKEKFTVYTESDNLFLQMLQPQLPAGSNNTNTSPAFPEGNIGFLNSISPIGTKFKPAADMGPQSQKNTTLNYTPVTGTLWFDFNER